MSTPDYRLPVLAAEEARAAAAVAPGYGGEQGLPDHHAEIMAAHEGRPTVAEQDRTHGAGIPAEDRGAG